MINKINYSKDILSYTNKKNLSKIFFFSIFLLWALIIGTLIGKGSSLGWFLIIVTAFVPALFLNNTLLLAGLIVFIFVIKGTLGTIFGVLPRQAIWASDAVIMFLFFKSFVLKVRQRNFEKTTLFLPIVLFFLWAILSGFLNGISWFTIGVALKDFFRYVLLFYAIVNLNIEGKILKRLITIFIIIIFLQVPIIIFQYHLYGQCDYVSGTLGRGGTGEMLILMTGMISLLIGFFLIYKSNIMYLLGISYLLISHILGTARAALFLIPLTIIFIIRKSLHGRKLGKILTMSLILAGFVYFVISIPSLKEPVNSLISGTVKGLNSQVNAVVMGSGRTPGRLRAPRIAFEWINKRYLAPIFGYGFGSTKESYFEGYTGRFFQTYSPRTNQLSLTLIEMGYPGLIFYLWLIFIVFRMNLIFFRNIKDNYWKAISFGVDGIIFLHFVGCIYHDIWRTSYSCFPFWFFSAIIYSVGKQKKIFE